MRSSNKPTGQAGTYPFVAEGGVAFESASDRDPFEALDDPMVVVAALCLTWPPRAITREGLLVAVAGKLSNGL